MKCITVVMGQAVVGNLDRLWLGTNNLMTCSAIIFYNKKSRRGGIYHYPSGALESHDAASANRARVVIRGVIRDLGLKRANALILRVPGSSTTDEAFGMGLGNDDRSEARCIAHHLMDNFGLAMRALPASGTVRVGKLNGRIYTQNNLPLGSQALTRQTGGASGKLIKIIVDAGVKGPTGNTEYIRLFGWDDWTDDTPAQVVVAPPRLLPRHSGQSSHSSIDELFDINLADGLPPLPPG